jgi:hypothetical protein
LYFRPNSLQEALNVLADTRATVLAGGTDVFPSLGDRPLSGPVLDISGLAEIRGIQVTPEHIVFGARTTWTEVITAPLPRGFDGLKAAAREVGSVQIQNAATIAGNLCNASLRIYSWKQKDGAVSGGIAYFDSRSTADSECGFDISEARCTTVSGDLYRYGRGQSRR